ncbi:hypothetical protein ACWCXH_15220 [Kitasatospora sp. NPDC001660]
MLLRPRPAAGPPAGAPGEGWYDFTVTVDADGSWSQRFTGHLETGAPSVSG